MLIKCIYHSLFQQALSTKHFLKLIIENFMIINACLSKDRSSVLLQVKKQQQKPYFVLFLQLYEFPSLPIRLSLDFILFSLHLPFFECFLLANLFLSLSPFQEKLLRPQLLLLLLKESLSPFLSLFVHSTRSTLFSNITLLSLCIYLYDDY